jgi:hypothetical protein
MLLPCRVREGETGRKEPRLSDSSPHNADNLDRSTEAVRIYIKIFIKTTLRPMAIMCTCMQRGS